MAVLLAGIVPAQVGPIYVPDLSGRTLDQAVSLLERNGLRRGSVTEQPSGLPAGTVISQFPRPGTRAQSGELVDIVLAESRAASTVPDVTGQTLFRVEEILSSQGLRRGTVTREQSVQRPGTVISQSPRPGTPAQPGMMVDLVIAADRPGVPDLLGRTLQQAVTLLRAAGLQRGIVSSEESNQLAGTVIAQFPPAGTAVQPGTMINLTLAIPQRLPPEEPPAEEPGEEDEGVPAAEPAP